VIEKTIPCTSMERENSMIISQFLIKMPVLGFSLHSKYSVEQGNALDMLIAINFLGDQ